MGHTTPPPFRFCRGPVQAFMSRPCSASNICSFERLRRTFVSVLLDCVMLCYVVLDCAMLCYVVLDYVMVVLMLLCISVSESFVGLL